MTSVLTMILAGGEGTRLHPLTNLRAKPAVPFGGSFRIIDFVLSNFVNSNFLKIFVLTQFKSHSLMTHMRQGWRVSGLPEMFIDPIPAQMQKGKKWYEGTADAIYQNLNLIDNEQPDVVFVFGGDHIYKMDVRQMLDLHKQKKAELTVAAIPVPVSQAHHFGVIVVDEEWRMIGFQEKPKVNAATIPGDPEHVLASMGNYCFNTDVLVDELNKDAANPESDNDFGKNIIPNLYPKGSVYVYDFHRNRVPGALEREHGYWRDVGTIDAYYEANMDLTWIEPIFNLYNSRWPVYTFNPSLPPAKFVHSGENRTGHAINSIVASGCILSGGTVERSVLGFGVRVHSYSHVTDSVLLDNVEVGRGARLHRTISDKQVVIGQGVHIGFDQELDRKRGLTVSDSGITVIPKGAKILK